jgi:hypothetical protein
MESAMAKDMSPAERKAWEKAYGAKPGGLAQAVKREGDARDARASLKAGLEALAEDRR